MRIENTLIKAQFPSMSSPCCLCLLSMPGWRYDRYAKVSFGWQQSEWSVPLDSKKAHGFAFINAFPSCCLQQAISHRLLPFSPLPWARRCLLWSLQMRPQVAKQPPNSKPTANAKVMSINSGGWWVPAFAPTHCSSLRKMSTGSISNCRAGMCAQLTAWTR